VPILPALVLPPRPPELPTVPPPVTADKPPDFKRNDAFLSRWIEDFERVIKDGWIKLTSLLQSFDDRIVALEKRIADTYTYGQKGVITLATPPEEGGPTPLTFLALPLRVVRDEELVEVVATCEIPAATTPTTFTIQHGPHKDAMANVTSLTLGVGVPLAQITLATPRKMKRNDVLRVLVAEASLEAADFIVQVRCR